MNTTGHKGTTYFRGKSVRVMPICVKSIRGNWSGGLPPGKGIESIATIILVRLGLVHGLLGHGLTVCVHQNSMTTNHYKLAVCNSKTL